MTLLRLSFALLLLPAVPDAGAFALSGIETFVLGCADPPALSPYPTEGDVALVACSVFPVGVFALTVAPGAPIALDTRFPPFFLPADLNGDDPDPTALAFIDDVWVERPDLAWVTTSNFELVVPYDPTTGTARRVRFEGTTRVSVPTALEVEGTFTRTDGLVVTRFTTSFTSGVARVGHRLMVSTSNFARPGTDPVLYPGTVLLFDVQEESDGTLLVSPATPPFVITTDPNPTALTVLPSGLVAVTNTGILDLLNPPRPAGPGSVDVLDPLEGAILGSYPLGESNPGFRQIAVDPSGSVGILGSAVFHELYALDIRGLEALPRPSGNPREQRPSCHEDSAWETGGIPCLRGRVIAGPGGELSPPIALPGGSAFGLVSEVRFAGEGSFVLATLFNEGQLAALSVDLEGAPDPAPLLRDRFGPAELGPLTPPLGTPGAETGPGPFVLLDPPGGDLDGSTVVWVTRGPAGTVMRGTVSDPPAIHVADTDGDGARDALDLCPRTPSGSDDRDGDGVGDVCDLCPDHPNPRGLRLPHETRRDGQRDDDGDGRGNVCDAAFASSPLRVGSTDLEKMVSAAGRGVEEPGCPGPTPASEVPCAAYDLDERGSRVSVSDQARAVEMLGTAAPVTCPGCDVPCAGPACRLGP